MLYGRNLLRRPHHQRHSRPACGSLAGPWARERFLSPPTHSYPVAIQQLGHFFHNFSADTYASLYSSSRHALVFVLPFCMFRPRRPLIRPVPTRFLSFSVAHGSLFYSLLHESKTHPFSFHG